jgi:type I pantothenate kinase
MFGAGEIRGSMDQLAPTERYSPYRFFTAERWAEFRADTPLTLTEDEVQRLSSLYEPIDLDEVRRIYLSLSRLLYAHVEASQLLFRQRQVFFSGGEPVKTPFIIGMAGSVAVGKSTTARVLKELLGRWPSSPKVFSIRMRFCGAKTLWNAKAFPTATM